MSILNKKITTPLNRKLFMISSVSLLVFLGFQALSYIIGLNEVSIFLTVAASLYLYLLIKISFVFDLNLKKARAYEEATEYYNKLKLVPLKELRIVFRGTWVRFQYLRHWRNWRHFQNYLILPGFVYWGVIILLFLNPFTLLTKQLLIIFGTILMTVVMWHFKMVFITYGRASVKLRYLMFSSMILSLFLIHSGMLGLKWYFAESTPVYIVAVFACSFLLFYQSLFHRAAVNFKNISTVFLGALIMAAVAWLVVSIWTVNYYSAGALLAGIGYTYWGLFLLHLAKKLTLRQVLEHAWVMVFVLFFVLATTNFSARVG